MAEQENGEILIPPRPPRRGRLGFWMVIGPAALLTAIGIAILSLTGKPVTLPDWVTARIERSMNARSPGLGVDLGSVVVEVNGRGNTRVALQNVALSGPDGASLGQFNTVSARLQPGALIEGTVRAASLSVTGAQLTVRRAADGAFAIRVGGGTETMGDLASLLDRLDALFATDALSGIGRISARDLTITVEDARTGRLWQVSDGEINLRNNAENIEINVISEIFDGTEILPRVQLSFDARKGSRAATLTARIENAPARDIALQSPALGFLGALDARVSGALRTVIAGDGTMESLDGSLDIGEGALRPAARASPVAFNTGRAYFSYDPEQQKIAFSQISAESDTIRLSGRGIAYLRDFEGYWPATLLSQVSLDRIELAPQGVFADAVRFDRLIADYRLRLDPFSVEFGQVVLMDESTRVEGSGHIEAGPEGWTGGFDLAAPALTPDRLVALWPLELGPKTRRWLEENLLGGRLSDVVAAIRLRPGHRPRLGFTFDFTDAEVRYLPKMPAVSEGRGHAAMLDGALSIGITEGRVPVGDGNEIDVGGTSFRIEDVFAQPGQATLRLSTRSDLPDILRVMDNPPFRVLARADRPADMLDATAALDVEAHFPLKEHLRVSDVPFTVTGTLTDARSDTLIEGRTLTADSLDVRVVPGRLSLSGGVRLDALPLEVTFSQPLERESGEPGRVRGTVELSQRFLDTLGIGLPPGTVEGVGSGTLALTLHDGAPPDFSLRSDLAGLTLAVPALGWSKPASETGTLAVSGHLGPVPEVEKLEIKGAGLEATGTVTLAEGGVFSSADFDRVVAGTWLDAPVSLQARGEGQAPRIAIRSGSVDLGRRPETAGGGDPVPLSVRLDRLAVTDTIALTEFAGDFTAGSGLDGRFQARVNGRAPVTGVLVPQRGRTAIRVQGDNAGAILRSSGVFRSLEQGSFDLILSPRQGADGYDGQIEMNDAILGDQSVLVGMLDAVSIVGLIDQLKGPGVAFDRIQGRFRLTEERLTLTQGSAVGPSLGVSLDGVYDIANKRLDMQGVMSPIYLLNAVGQVFTRRGEGLFGFTFRLRGDAADPRVSVNPLSILTPGMFREIFRRAPPE